jgi:hypothetical protein
MSLLDFCSQPGMKVRKRASVQEIIELRRGIQGPRIIFIIKNLYILSKMPHLLSKIEIYYQNQNSSAYYTSRCIDEGPVPAHLPSSQQKTSHYDKLKEQQERREESHEYNQKA